MTKRKTGRPRTKPRTSDTTQRVNVDFPTTMLATIDAECNRLGIARQAWIKLKLDRALAYSDEVIAAQLAENRAAISRLKEAGA